MPAFISINQITSLNQLYPTANNPSAGNSLVTDKATVNANMLRQFITDSRFGGILFAGGIPNAALADISGAKIVNLSITGGKIANNTISPDKLSTGAPIWNSSGKVGVGVSSTQLKDKLYVDGVLRLKPGTSEGFAVGEQEASNTYIAFEASSTTGTSDWAYLRDIGTSDELHVSLDLHDNGDGSSGQRFSIRNVNSTENTADVATSRFTIDISGKVGINQDTPTERLHVVGNIRGETIYGTTAVEARDGTTTKSSFNKDGQGYLSSSLGIGTNTIPTGAKLVVSAGAIVPDNGTGIRFDGGITDKNASITYNVANSRLSISTANTIDDHLILFPSGRVGVKNNSPASELDVSGTITTTGLNINGTSGNTRGGMISLIRSNTSNLAGRVQIEVVGTGIRFIDSNNNWGAFLDLTKTAASTNEIITDNNISLKLRTNLVTIEGDQTIRGNKTFEGTVALPAGATVGGVTILTSGAVTNTFSSIVVGTQASKATIQYTTNTANTYNIPALPSGTTSTNLVVTNGDQTISGTLGVSAPTADGHAATRKYVSDSVSGLALASSVTTISNSVTTISNSLASTYRYGGRVNYGYGSNGTHTFIKGNYTGLRGVLVKMVGAGGGGGGAATTTGSQIAVGGSGGGGQYVEAWYTAAELSDNTNIVIGNGGTAGGVGNSAGGTGGTTSFGSREAQGGGGGSGGSAVTVGSGGSFTSFTFSTYTRASGVGGGTTDDGPDSRGYTKNGESGQTQVYTSRTNLCAPAGGSSVLGSGARIQTVTDTGADGVFGQGPGGGGGGGINPSSETVGRTGKAGRTGYVIVELYY